MMKTEFHECLKQLIRAGKTINDQMHLSIKTTTQKLLSKTKTFKKLSVIETGFLFL